MRTYGIIGRPLGHSFSKGYFEAKFAALGLSRECRYLNFPLETIADLAGVMEKYPDLAGFNVTIPYKREIMSWLHSVSDEAREIGAVNCVKVAKGKLHGYNTDVHGFRVGLEKLLRPERSLGTERSPGSEKPSGGKAKKLPDEGTAGIRALVLGTGGAAAAVEYELEKADIEFLSVSRTKSALSTTYRELTPETVAQHRLIVNTTPLGTFPDTDSLPDIPYEGVGPDHYLYDLVYNPPLTAFLAQGVRRGAAVLNGETMLHAQAEKAWEIWNH